MQSPHCISSKWAEPKSSYRAEQGVAEVLNTECYSLQNVDCVASINKVSKPQTLKSYFLPDTIHCCQLENDWTSFVKHKIELTPFTLTCELGVVGECCPGMAEVWSSIPSKSGDFFIQKNLLPIGFYLSLSLHASVFEEVNDYLEMYETITYEGCKIANLSVCQLHFKKKTSNSVTTHFCLIRRGNLKTLKPLPLTPMLNQPFN